MEAKRPVQLEPSWLALLEDCFSGPSMDELRQFLQREKQSGKVIYPPGKLIFNAFTQCPVDQVKVVILGQDPYHNPGQANGLSFSVPERVPIPPSLQNIYKELFEDLKETPEELYYEYGKPRNGDLSHWARQGVLLLNSVLTVERGRAASHQGRGWEEFTSEVIARLTRRRPELVFILWGAYAERKAQFVDSNRNCILRSPHPSPLSAHRGFFGSRPFSRCNRYLQEHGKAPIRW